MSIRHILYVSYGVLAVVLLLVGGMALITHTELSRALTELGSPSDTVNRLLTRADWIIALVTGTGLLAAIGLGWYAVRSVAQPLDRLIEATDALRSGQLSTRIDVSGPTEVEMIGRALNQMTETVSQRTVSRSYLNNVLDSMAEMLFVVDEDGRIQRVNRAAQQRLGYTGDELKHMTIDDLFVDPPGSSNEQLPENTYASAEHHERAVRTSDDTTLPVLFSRAAVHDEMGMADGGFVCVAQDLTAQKNVEDRLRASLEEKTVLLQEVHHRVKNNLQVISSLLHLQSSKVEDEKAQALFKDSQSRIRSMALLHEKLYQSKDIAQVAVASYLDELIEHLFRTYGAHRSRIERTLEAEEIPLTIDQAIPCGLIVNELITNALEHAFPEGQGGTIRVALTMAAGDVQLVVEDDGQGFPDNGSVNETDSLGLRLVRGLVQQLNGTLDVASTPGAQFTITFPHT